MEHFEKIQKYLTEQVCNHLETGSIEELGEVIDMMKDMAEVIYYHTIVEAMHNE